MDTRPRFRAVARNGIKFFTRNSSGKFKFYITGIWISYVIDVYDFSAGHLKQERIGYANSFLKTRVQFEQIFVPHEMLTYMLMSGQYITDAIEVDHIINAPSASSTRHPITVPLTIDDIVTGHPEATKTLKNWDVRSKTADSFTVTAWRGAK